MTPTIHKISDTPPQLSAREMAFKFLNCPLHIKLEIAKKAGLLEDGDMSMTPDIEMCKTFFRRATERNKVSELSAAIREFAPDAPQPPASGAGETILPMKTAIELIAAERTRQIKKEGYDSAHDDQLDDNSLGRAAACYALDSKITDKEIWGRPLLDLIWPFDPEYWKPDASRIRNLVKAGALIAAQIEKLQRIEGGQS